MHGATMTIKICCGITFQLNFTLQIAVISYRFHCEIRGFYAGEAVYTGKLICCLLDRTSL